MNTSIVIATHGDPAWEELAWSMAYPSTLNQNAVETIVTYLEDGTLAEARNRGARDARGDWLCFLDADDQLDDGYLLTMSAAAVRAGLHRPHVRLVVDAFDAEVIVMEEIPTGEALLIPAVQYVEAGRCVGTPSIPAWGRELIDLNCAVIGTLVPRHLFNRVGGFREFEMYEDWDLWLRCVLAGATLVAVPDAVYCAARSTGGRNTSGDAVATYNLIRNEHLAGYSALG